MALRHRKHVFVENPMAMTEAGANAIIEAEASSTGKVMVGYMRRYATAFADAVREIGGLDCVLYARVRDINGPNSAFVGQSGTFPKYFTDHQQKHVDEKIRIAAEIAKQGIEVECQVAPSLQLIQQYRLFGSLGSHDLSAMREALGMPQSVIGASLGPPFWSVLFKYPTFTVTYESGLHNVPLFDAHVEVYGNEKSVMIRYDTPYVRGLPITMTVREHVDGALRETITRRTYEGVHTRNARTVRLVGEWHGN